MNQITAASMSTSVNIALANYEPRLEVLNTNIQAKASENDVHITITGRVKSSNEIVDISTTIERLR
jgi:predicted component of type VI protein secretion system